MAAVAVAALFGFNALLGLSADVIVDAPTTNSVTTEKVVPFQSVKPLTPPSAYVKPELLGHRR